MRLIPRLWCGCSGFGLNSRLKSLPYVFGVIKSGKCKLLCSLGSSCARRDRFRQQKKRTTNNAEFFRVTNFSLYPGEIDASQICHPNPGSSCRNPACPRRQRCAGHGADRNRQDTGLPDSSHGAAAPANTRREYARLVLVPTRELAMQVVDQYNALRGTQLSPAALVVGGLSEGTQLTRTPQGSSPGSCDSWPPGRLSRSRTGRFSRLQVLILDEADRMLDMGFLPAIRRIA